jgi:ribosome recycling factor
MAMKVYVLKFFFNGDDIENVVKGVYSTKDRAIYEIVKQIEHENNNNISDYDRPFEISEDNEFRYEDYIQHFGEIYFEVEEVELDKESELNA